MPFLQRICVCLFLSLVLTPHHLLTVSAFRFHQPNDPPFHHHHHPSRYALLAKQTIGPLTPDESTNQDSTLGQHFPDSNFDNGNVPPPASLTSSSSSDSTSQSWAPALSSTPSTFTKNLPISSLTPSSSLLSNSTLSSSSSSPSLLYSSPSNPSSSSAPVSLSSPSLISPLNPPPTSSFSSPSSSPVNSSPAFLPSYPLISSWSSSGGSLLGGSLLSSSPTSLSSSSSSHSSNTSSNPSSSPSSASSNVPSSASSGSSPGSPSVGTTNIEPAGTPAPAAESTTNSTYFYGANSYYLHAYDDSERREVLDALVSAGMKVLRIFVSAVQQNNKGSQNRRVDDVEPKVIGEYDDTILRLIDQLLLEASGRGIKLIIALGDRYSLGYWDTDAYAYTFGIVDGGSGAQKVADASSFYKNPVAIAAYDNRINYILNHRNELMGNKTWSQLKEAIYAFEPQNEPQGHMENVAPKWVCNRAATIANNTQGNEIMVSTGGGTTLKNSLEDWVFRCPSINLISVHDYGTSPSSTVSTLTSAKERAEGVGKVVLFEEWGAKGNDKSETVGEFIDGMREQNINWMYWEVTKPGQGKNDFEVWTDEPTWDKLLTGGNAPKSSQGHSEKNKRKQIPFHIPGSATILNWSQTAFDARQGHKVGNRSRIPKKAHSETRGLENLRVGLKEE